MQESKRNALLGMDLWGFVLRARAFFLTLTEMSLR